MLALRRNGINVLCVKMCGVLSILISHLKDMDKDGQGKITAFFRRKFKFNNSAKTEAKEVAVR